MHVLHDANWSGIDTSCEPITDPTVYKLRLTKTRHLSLRLQIMIRLIALGGYIDRARDDEPTDR